MRRRRRISPRKHEPRKKGSVIHTRKTELPQSTGSSNTSLLTLQRTIGNQAVQRLIESGAIQAKLRVGQPGDKYEQEADRVADQVMQMPEQQVQRQPEEEEEEQIQTKPLAEQITPWVQRQVEEEKEEETIQTKQLSTEPSMLQRQVEPEEEEPVQLKFANGIQVQRQEEEPEEEEEEPIQAKDASGQTPRVTPNLQTQIHSMRGGGQPLPESTRAFFEPRFGRDFSDVRVHTDTNAAKAAKSANAKAFTTGKDVVFGSEQYAPGSGAGKRLLAHELTHVVQQGNKSLLAKNVSKIDNRKSISTPFIQLETNSEVDTKTIEWEKGLKTVEDLAKKNKTKAKKYYKELVVRAAKKVTAPAPLIDKKPTINDINWSWTVSSQWSATTNPKLVDDYPNNYWKWLTFNPGAVQKEEAWTISAILHELDHAAHAKALYNEWIKAGKKGKWDVFWVTHFTKWTETPIQVGAQAGVIGAIEGLPKKISPSAIEFRAYVNQFINFFHKFSLKKQALIAKAIILFYPLVKQKVKEIITDPSLDVSVARNQVLDYFRSPPVKGEDQQNIIRIRVASEFKSALLFFRPPDDYMQIKKDFQDIFDYKFSKEERMDARKGYKPQK